MKDDSSSAIRSRVSIRQVSEGDIPSFFEHQMDPDANELAAVPAKDEVSFKAHWSRIKADPAVASRTVLFDGEIAGNIVTFDRLGHREIGYWIGRQYWGNGVGTEALRAFLDCEKRRPLLARVARHNHGSIRILEKCGFSMMAESEAACVEPLDDTDELLLTLKDP